MAHEPTWCPILRPTQQQFQRPFTEFVAEVFAKDPTIPMFKVCPPEGWRARHSKFPPLTDITINTPIRQNVFGTKGAYRCIFEEQESMNVDEFKLAAIEEGCAMPAMQRKQCSTDDSVVERAFWSGITLAPPLYGADTPVSFFDEKLPYGWNLQELGDLLKTKNVPNVPGVTTPMTYFGMWRSFFGWHKEDADLLSINFLHWGAPKMWYCVSPKDQAKFDRMAQGIFPQLHRACPAFIRHKDILLSPSLLRTHGIPYVQAKQEEGEFIVLNASAYHSGFNMGFNCAEAINFATPAWVDAGKAAVPCTCRSDGVHISMRLFDPNWTGSDSEADCDEEGAGLVGEMYNASWTKGRGGSAQKRAGRGGKRGGPGSAAKRRLSADGGGSKPARSPQSVGRGRGNWQRRLRATGAMEEGERLRQIERDEVVGMPSAIVGEEDEQGAGKFFCLVQQVNRPATTGGMIVLRWLREGPDGMYRPEPTYWEEKPDALIAVRTQFLPHGTIRRVSAPQPSASGASSGKGSQSPGVEGGKKAAAWKLLTLKSRILDTDLLD